MGNNAGISGSFGFGEQYAPPKGTLDKDAS
jgi:hypothetical protein